MWFSKQVHNVGKTNIEQRMSITIYRMKYYYIISPFKIVRVLAFLDL